MERELEEISSLRKKAYKWAYKHGDQKNEVFPKIVMEEPKEMSNNKNAEQLDVYNVAYSPKQQVKKDIAEKLYQVLSFSESILIQEIDKCKIDVGTDKKRCHNRLNKGRIDLEYSKQMESLVHRIQHGNNKRAEEAKLYHEIKNLNDSIEIYTEPTAVNETWRRNWPWRPALPKGYKQQQLKNIKCMERELEEISSLRKKAYKCAYKHGDQQNEVGIHNVSPNGVFGNKVYGGDSEGFGVNPSSDEFRLCNSDGWRFINSDGPMEIRGYGVGGDMVDQRGVWIIGS
ncbi:hypothetical protein Tco_1121554 [Tanacetum coccineum]|uniref:Uncharacterized protein n=1 Tax=Tanacetum coccineum TaxID=301880 RepID=A0ABQ5IY07_9ASTR